MAFHTVNFNGVRDDRLMSEIDKEIEDILKSVKTHGREEAIATAITDMSDTKKIEFFTYLFQSEDDSLATLIALAERYEYSWLQEIIQHKLMLRSSVGGWRATQLEKIATEGAKAGSVSRLQKIKQKLKDVRKGIEV